MKTALMKQHRSQRLEAEGTLHYPDVLSIHLVLTRPFKHLCFVCSSRLAECSRCCFHSVKVDGLSSSTTKYIKLTHLIALCGEQTEIHTYAYSKHCKNQFCFESSLSVSQTKLWNISLVFLTLSAFTSFYGEEQLRHSA